MSTFDIVIHGGTVATASDTVSCDVGIRDGRITALAQGLGGGTRRIDATGKLVLPGGIDSHCHIEQIAAAGIRNADDFYSGTVAAAFGGNTTVIPFAAQRRGQSLRQAVEDYHACAEPKAVIDYAFHLIVTDPTDQVLGQELPALIRDGYTSFKIFVTYELLKIDDYQVLQVLEVARREGALVMVHAENDDAIRFLGERLLEEGHREPRFFTVAHTRIGEGEATHRVIALSQLLDVPLLVVHVSSAEATDQIRWAQNQGLKVFGETCPQYLFLTAEDSNLPGTEGAKYICSPPPRDEASQEAIWRGIINGTFQLVSSDHAPYRYDDTGKLASGPNPDFEHIAAGMPGIETRLPLLFSEGVGKGRIDLNHFVALSSTNAAKIYGIHPRKGTIAVGSDADIAIWDPSLEVQIGTAMLHDNVGYTPYEGRTVKGWPITVVRRGEVIVEGGELHVERGSGEFLRCASPNSARPAGRLETETDPEKNFGANVLGPHWAER